MANHSNIFAVRIPPMNSMTRQKYMTLEDELPRSEGVQHATREEQRAITNSPRKNGGSKKTPANA